MCLDTEPDLSSIIEQARRIQLNTACEEDTAVLDRLVSEYRLSDCDPGIILQIAHSVLQGTRCHEENGSLITRCSGVDMQLVTNLLENGLLNDDQKPEIPFNKPPRVIKNWFVAEIDGFSAYLESIGLNNTSANRLNLWISDADITYVVSETVYDSSVYVKPFIVSEKPLIRFTSAVLAYKYRLLDDFSSQMNLNLESDQLLQLATSWLAAHEYTHGLQDIINEGLVYEFLKQQGLAYQFDHRTVDSLFDSEKERLAETIAIGYLGYRLKQLKPEICDEQISQLQFLAEEARVNTRTLMLPLLAEMQRIGPLEPGKTIADLLMDYTTENRMQELPDELYYRLSRIKIYQTLGRSIPYRGNQIPDIIEAINQAIDYSS
ncbi:MAG: hypothetical protein QY330_04130 [Candidatus Dojkabacteria bacterium]|uniref:Uncharacterized protein n=1 Tax=Candidatus Dojkabacteria bacterium TaxID=2099670 RepID=A0A952AJQ0_9BACT|nr:hypothetical protein [Candidatus Dojkabacteria bacterium]WKZ27710.1 MAG: hypothetical protein QY330_04130 [Candidatus Dojkabacteria bacterium]